MSSGCAQATEVQLRHDRYDLSVGANKEIVLEMIVLRLLLRPESSEVSERERDGDVDRLEELHEASGELLTSRAKFIPLT